VFTFTQTATLNVSTSTQVSLPGLSAVTFDLKARSRVALTYLAQVYNNNEFQGAHCSTWYYLDGSGTTLANAGGHGAGFVMPSGTGGQSMWWNERDITAFADLPAGRHTVDVRVARSGGNGGTCHYSPAYGGGQLWIQATPL
jgi:hypothetical protein